MRALQIAITTVTLTAVLATVTPLPINTAFACDVSQLTETCKQGIVYKFGDRVERADIILTEIKKSECFEVGEELASVKINKLCDDYRIIKNATIKEDVE